MQPHLLASSGTGYKLPLELQQRSTRWQRKNPLRYFLPRFCSTTSLLIETSWFAHSSRYVPSLLTLIQSKFCRKSHFFVDKFQRWCYHKPFVYIWLEHYEIWTLKLVL